MDSWFIDLIKRYEGFKDTAYDDHGHYSIGYGSDTMPNGKPVLKGDKITEAEAAKLIPDFINKKIHIAKEAFPDFDKYPKQVQYALIDHIYRGGSFDDSPMFVNKLKSALSDGAINVEEAKSIIKELEIYTKDSEGNNPLKGVLNRKRRRAAMLLNIYDPKLNKSVGMGDNDYYAKFDTDFADPNTEFGKIVKSRETILTPIKSNNKDQTNNSHELTDYDWWALGSIAGDLSGLVMGATGIGAPAAAITGMASTGALFVSDVKRDGFQWGDLGSAALGLGLDALTFIPGLGEAAKTAKIGKRLKTLAPIVLKGFGYAMGAMGAVGAVLALKKAARGEKLTTDDIRQIVNGVMSVRALKNLHPKNERGLRDTAFHRAEEVGARSWDNLARDTKTVVQKSIKDNDFAGPAYVLSGSSEAKTRLPYQNGGMDLFESKLHEGDIIDMLFGKTRTLKTESGKTVGHLTSDLTGISDRDIASFRSIKKWDDWKRKLTGRKIELPEVLRLEREVVESPYSVKVSPESVHQALEHPGVPVYIGSNTSTGLKTKTGNLVLSKTAPFGLTDKLEGLADVGHHNVYLVADADGNLKMQGTDIFHLTPKSMIKHNDIHFTMAKNLGRGWRGITELLFKHIPGTVGKPFIIQWDYAPEVANAFIAKRYRKESGGKLNYLDLF